ncbi:MAG: 2,3-bisphosphoglycerate-independent phosphoglycerate mutase [Alphaproteobacteria bacterium]|jgi:2,3-bisphosphoglycerate-independent phosphoglycerate mutase|nr:2,3-bisphosphoglycerate-independent phosphoglycerate mutase [Alphaproteobacteria bacterium]
MKPVVLCILDGFGHNPNKEFNAIELAKTPNIDSLFEKYPHTLISASGLDVGLPDGQMGNSEVGHMNIGAGRVVLQDLPKIEKTIKEDTLKDQAVLANAIATLKENGKTCHISGLLSSGGVHSHIDQIEALAKAFSEQGITVKVHALLDGRDTPPSSAVDFLADFEKRIEKMENVSIATIAGRFYGMDRDNNWNRVEPAYNAIVSATGESFCCADKAIKDSYENGKTDEFVIPCVIEGYKGMEDGDAFIFANFRADRAREITKALFQKSFEGFDRDKVIEFSTKAGMTEYSSEHNDFMDTIFPPEELKNVLGKVVSDKGLNQLRIAETEKYAHVTFFLNGGEEKVYEGEDRILVNSPKVETYDLQPEMSAPEVCDKLVDAINSGKYDLVVVNFANCDMVGHTGVLEAAVKAVETVDTCVGKVVEAVKSQSGAMLMTADHGNSEKMWDEEGNCPFTAHTTNLVPLIAIECGDVTLMPEGGKLANIAPTILKLMEVEQPAEMTEESLF